MRKKKNSSFFDKFPDLSKPLYHFPYKILLKTKDITRPTIFSLFLCTIFLPALSQAQTNNHLDCYSCHGPTTVTFHHATTQFQNGDCTFCHTGVVVTGDCSSCHPTIGGLDNPHHLLPDAVNGNCAACHTGVGDLTDCLGCHGGKVRMPHHATPDALAGNCMSCHTQLQPNTGCATCHNWSGGNPHHTSSWAVNGDCYYCHDMVWDATINAYVTQLRSCEDCHGTIGGTTAERHHSTEIALQGQCTVCHVGADNTLIDCAGCHVDPNKHHALVASMAYDCTFCHTTIQLVTNDCATCHAPPGGTIADTHHGTPLTNVGGDCAFCHAGASDPKVCANCHMDNPHHTSMWATAGDCTHCHMPPASAMDVPKQAACRECHGPTKHNKGGPTQDFGACFACHAPMPYHAKPTVAPTWWETAPGKGSFNIFYSQYVRPEEFYEDTPLEEFGENVIEDIQGRPWMQPSIAFNWATIDYMGTMYDVPHFDGQLMPPPMVDSSPMINIKNPNPGDTVSGTVTIGAYVSDPDGIRDVYAWVGGYEPIRMLGPDTTPGPVYSGTYTASWNTTMVADGLHIIYVQAIDNSMMANVASEDLPLTVANGSGTTNGSSLTMCTSCHGDYSSMVSCSNTVWQDHLTQGRVSEATYELAEMTYLGSICPRNGGTPGADLSVCTSCHGDRGDQIRCYDHEWRDHADKGWVDQATMEAAEMYYLGYLCDIYQSSSITAPDLTVCTSCHSDKSHDVDCDEHHWTDHLTENWVTPTVYEAAEMAYLGYHCGGGYSHAGVIDSGGTTPTGTATGGMAAGGSILDYATLDKCTTCHINRNRDVNCASKMWRKHLRTNKVGRTEFEAAELTALGKLCNDDETNYRIPKNRSKR